MKYFLIVSALVAAAYADSTPDFFELPSNATAVVRTINYGFDCAGRQFGYYADPANGCQIFHLCYPFEDAEGTPQLRMWSFLCGLGSVFDQAALVCNHPVDATPCDQAESFYRVNDYFHKEDVEFRSSDASFVAA